jgi:hypothetical protein
MSKQTAVQWFINEIVNHIDMPSNHFDELKEQAKEMEKQQIMEAHYAPKYGCFSEDYYNENYGGDQ